MPPPVPPPLPILITPPEKDNDKLMPVQCVEKSAGEDQSHDEASMICKRFLYICLDASMLSWNRKVDPVSQNGPTCGFAALCMASELVRCHVNFNEAVDLAKSRGFTNCGEMFSAANMCTLIRQMTNCQVELLNDGFSDRWKIFNHLSSGYPILAPYDADKNNEPCCKRGRKAHWTVLTGVILVIPQKYSGHCSGLVSDPSCRLLYHMTDSNTLSSDQLLSLVSNNDVVMYVYARQGKSRHLSAWHYKALDASNANLIELCPSRSLNQQRYLIPEGGVSAGLCKQIILMKPSSDHDT